MVWFGDGPPCKPGKAAVKQETALPWASYKKEGERFTPICSSYYTTKYLE